MAAPHRIRLRGPWLCEPVVDSAPEVALSPVGEPAGRPTSPTPSHDGTSAGPGAAVRTRWTRRFHRPTGLQAGEQVVLVIAAAEGPGWAMLNGALLGPVVGSQPSRFVITPLMHWRNELVIELQSRPPAPGGPTPTAPAPGTSPPGGGLRESVYLEITSPRPSDA